jgi:hypothetical protein
MFELLTEAFAWCWRLLKADLPDCVLILHELKTGKRSIPPASKGYLWICHLTALASLVRAVAVAWLLAAVIDLLLHFRFSWPPYDFQDSHYIIWALSFPQGSLPMVGADSVPIPGLPLHFCLPLAIVAMTTFVLTALSYYGVARLSTELVGVVCPISVRPARVTPRRRKNEVA